MILRLAALLFVAMLVVIPVNALPAQAAGVTIHTFSVVSDYPRGVKVTLVADSDSEITSIIAGITSGSEQATGVKRPEFTPGKHVEATFNVSPGYVPPFGEIALQLTIEDSAGNRVKTAQSRTLYEDTRYTWSTSTDGLVTTYWHDSGVQRAAAIQRSAVQTIARVNAEAGLKFNTPVKMVMYNNKTEMDSVIPFRSAATQRELVMEGMAMGEHDLVLVLNDNLAVGTAAHELTHLIVGDAAMNQYFGLPVWLNEGLAVYFQGDAGVEYRSYFEKARRDGTLLPVRALSSLPGKPDENLLIYGQGYELVKYLIENYGAEKMGDYLRAYRDAGDHDTPMRKVYGFDRNEFDRRWRASLGIPVEPEAGIGAESGGSVVTSTFTREYAAAAPYVMAGVLGGMAVFMVVGMVAITLLIKVIRR